ncbi:MAG: acyl-CoA thioesterase [Sphingomonadales bacterium]|nr:acyl-CoA thioesterase [Sphingomonadales bacterium]
MPKPDPALLDPVRYPFRCSIETRFSDLDLNQHLNNVSLVGLLEEGRVRYHFGTGLTGLMGGAMPMVASLTVEFLGQSYFPDPLDVQVAATHLGRTSYTLCQLVSQKDRIVAFAQSVMVCTGPEGPVALPEAFRERAQSWMLKP